MATLDEALAALATMSPAQLRSEWTRVLDSLAPSAFSADLLARGIAWTLQERVHGGLRASAARKLGEAADQISRTGRAALTTPKLQPGSRLAREWHGRTHHVMVTDAGYLYRDRHYPSLTAIAREITGAAWSGPRFFGLVSRRSDREAKHAR